MQFSLEFRIQIYYTPAATYKSDLEVNDLHFWNNFTNQKTKKVIWIGKLLNRAKIYCCDVVQTNRGKQSQKKNPRNINMNTLLCIRHGILCYKL